REIIHFLEEHSDITAVFTLTEETARMTYTALQTLGRAVPEDVEMITFDDPDFIDIPRILQNEGQLGKAAVELLLAQITGSAIQEEKIVIPVEWKVNDSNK
ncbi:MAG TPA: substrate-binding domain-containing protein, partial [Bacilli bacterium]